MIKLASVCGLLCCSTLWACAGGAPAVAARLPHVELPQLTRARVLAPDYAVRVDRAFQDVQRESTARGRRQQLRRVEFLAMAAEAEADRVGILREAPAYEARLEQAIVERAQAERERVAVERARVVAQAAAQEKREAQWAFASLARGSATTPQARDRIWSFLLRRAQVLCAAARALGADPAELNEAELQLTAARTARLPSRIEQAREALAMAQRALGHVRARSQPSTAERLDLLERLRERGFEPTHDSEARALVIALPAEGTKPLRPAELLQRVSLLDDLLQAFPHGPILLTCGRSRGCSTSWFGAGLRERVRIQDGGTEHTSEVVRVALPAYADGPAAL